MISLHTLINGIVLPSGIFLEINKTVKEWGGKSNKLGWE